MRNKIYIKITRKHDDILSGRTTFFADKKAEGYRRVNQALSGHADTFKADTFTDDDEERKVYHAVLHR